MPFLFSSKKKKKNTPINDFISAPRYSHSHARFCVLSSPLLPNSFYTKIKTSVVQSFRGFPVCLLSVVRHCVRAGGLSRTRSSAKRTKEAELWEKMSRMALSISRKLLHSFGPLHALGCCNHPKILCRSFHNFNALFGHISGDTLSSAESSTFGKSESSFLVCRRLSTSILSPASSEGSFPSDLLSKKHVATPERTIGLYQDLVIPMTNFHNEDKGFMVLAGDVFDVPIRKDIVHRVVRWQLAKRQQGTHSTKTISEVSGTGRKPWRQKGTGRARHGTLRGPQFRHGAAMHGPKPRSHAIKLNKKVRRLGLKIALSARAAEGKLMIFEDLEIPTHKTKNIVNYVNQMENAKKILLVDGGPINEKLKLATQNLHYVNILPSIGLNVYSILLHDTLVMSRDAVNRIVERMHTPINR